MVFVRVYEKLANKRYTVLYFNIISYRHVIGRKCFLVLSCDMMMSKKMFDKARGIVLNVDMFTLQVNKLHRTKTPNFLEKGRGS